MKYTAIAQPQKCINKVENHIYYTPVKQNHKRRFHTLEIKNDIQLQKSFYNRPKHRKTIA